MLGFGYATHVSENGGKLPQHGSNMAHLNTTCQHTNGVLVPVCLAVSSVLVQVVAAAKDPLRRPCLLFGEPGLQKDNLAALVHFGSPDRNKPMVQVRLVVVMAW